MIWDYFGNAILVTRCCLSYDFLEVLNGFQGEQKQLLDVFGPLLDIFIQLKYLFKNWLCACSP